MQDEVLVDGVPEVVEVVVEVGPVLGDGGELEGGPVPPARVVSGQVLSAEPVRDRVMHGHRPKTAWVKGQSGNPTGRPKGAKGRHSATAKEAISNFIEMNAPRMQGWLDRIAREEGPLVAFKCVTEIIEYHIPKVARVEHTGKDEGPMEMVFSWKPPQD